MFIIINMKGGIDLKLSEIVKKYRKENKISTRAFAEKVGCTNAYISLIENEKVKSPSIGTINGIAKAMNRSLDSLLNEMDDMNIRMSEVISESKDTIDLENMPLPKNEIATYSQICCGNGLFIDDYIEDYIAIPDRYIKKGREYFANVASGDSMIGKSINDGDVLVFEKTNVLSNGDIGSFCIDDECVCKIFRQLNNGLIILESANDKYPPIEIDLADESQCFRIIGKLIATFKKY